MPEKLQNSAFSNPYLSIARQGFAGLTPITTLIVPTWRHQNKHEAIYKVVERQPPLQKTNL